MHTTYHKNSNKFSLNSFLKFHRTTEETRQVLRVRVSSKQMVAIFNKVSILKAVLSNESSLGRKVVAIAGRFIRLV